MKKKCNSSKSTCDKILPSDCVDYVGDTLTSLSKETNQCDLSMTEVTENLDKEIKKIKDSLDTKKLTTLCISSIKKEDDIVIILNKLISEICELSKELKEVKESYIENNILDSIVNLDSSCLSGINCANDSTLRSLLTKLISEVCVLKSRNNNSSNIYQP